MQICQINRNFLDKRMISADISQSGDVHCSIIDDRHDVGVYTAKCTKQNCSSALNDCVTLKPHLHQHLNRLQLNQLGQTTSIMCGLQSVVSKATLEMFIALFPGLPNRPVCIMQKCKQSKTGWCKDLGTSRGCSYSCRNVLV